MFFWYCVETENAWAVEASAATKKVANFILSLNFVVSVKSILISDEALLVERSYTLM